MRFRALLPALATALLAPLAVAPPAAAETTASPTVTSVTMVSEPGEYVGGGDSRLFTPHNGTVTLSGANTDFYVGVTGGTLGGEFMLYFSAPDGVVLTPGSSFPNAHSFPHDGGAALSVSGDYRDCLDSPGRFDVLDVQYVDGKPVRLHLLYERQCGRQGPRLFGEVRVGMPTSHSDLLVAPGQVAWPLTAPGEVGRDVPVTVVNTSDVPVSPGTPSIEGDASGSFAVRSSSCPTSLPPQASCVVDIGFRPSAPGSLGAVLTLVDSSGDVTRRVPLTGTSGLPSAPEPPPAPPAARFTDIAGDPHEDNIVVVAQDGIAGGYPDGTYRPRLSVTRGQMATFLTRALELPASPSAGFSDTAGHPHAAAIDAVAEWGIAGGYPDGSYRPDATVTRGQMATFLARALDLPFAPSAGFTDTAGDPHEQAIDAVAEWGITGGYPDGSYRPGNGVTRGQLATFLVRALYEPAEPSAS